jgi:PhnB protein
MAKKINAIPTGYRTATPALVVQNAAAAIEYYTNVFGAVELSRLYGDDGVIIWRAELKIGNSIIHLCDEVPAFGILSPISLGGTSGSVQLYLNDLDDAWARAIEADVTVVLPIEDTYWGERTGRIVDPFGHVWTLSKRVEAVSKAELSKRVEALYAPVVAQNLEVSDTAEEDIPTVDIRNVGTSDENNTVVPNANEAAPGA